MSSVNAGRIANILRSRCMMMVHELTGIYKPTISRQREKLMQVMNGQAEAAAKSELAKRMRVLKGFYTVEMAPPGSSEAGSEAMYFRGLWNALLSGFQITMGGAHIGVGSMMKYPEHLLAGGASRSNSDAWFSLKPLSGNLTFYKQIAADVKLITNFMKDKRFLSITVRQAWLLFLVGLEVFLWFFIGETIGKGHIVGYKV